MSWRRVRRLRDGAHYDHARYGQALAAVGSRAPASADTAMFARHAAGALEVEQSLHGSLLADLGIDPARAARAGPAPVNLAYTSYLLATVSVGSYAEGVGKELVRRGSPDPRYQRWTDLYGSEEFGDIVREVLAVTDQLGPALPPAERDRAHRHFRTSSRYEWMFWDMGYRMENWPV